MSNPALGFSWFDGASDVDAGITVRCLSVPMPPPPPPVAPPPLPPSGTGAVQYVCDETAQVIAVTGCLPDLPSYLPTAICSNFTITRDYIPATCHNFSVFQSLADPDLFMWLVDKMYTNSVNDYMLIGRGKTLCQFGSGLLSMKLPISTPPLNMFENMKQGSGFRFYDTAIGADAPSGANVQCLSYRLKTSGPSESALVGVIVGSVVAVTAALGAGISMYNHSVKRPKRVLVAAGTSKRFLF
jgi:hypothetical protein